MGVRNARQRRRLSPVDLNCIRQGLGTRGWLSPAWNESLDLRPDLDAIDALSSERDALWSRLEKTTFLTPDEKRAAIAQMLPEPDRPSAARA